MTWRYERWSSKEGQITAPAPDGGKTLIAAAILHKHGPLLTNAPRMLDVLRELTATPRPSAAVMRRAQALLEEIDNG